MKHLLVLSLISFATVAADAQTTTWRAADNPHVVQGNYTVPAGQSLVLEPGVRVEIRADSRLIVEGELIGNGTAANRITFTAENNYSAELLVRGTSDLKFADMKGKIVPEPNGTLLFSDCTFSGWGSILNGQALQLGPSRAAYVQVDRCTFIGDDPYFAASIHGAYFTVVARDTAFTEGSILSAAPAYLYLNNITSDGAQQYGLRVGADGDLFIDNVTVMNATEAGLALSGDTRNGTNVLIGPNVTLQNNAYPVHLTIAGLHKESAIPATGNRNNLINVSGSAGAGGRWPKFAIPYRVDGSPLTIGGPLFVDPGVVVKISPYTFFNDVSFGDGMRAFGTKDNPITFERENPDIAWSNMHAERGEGGRLRHVIIDGSSQGVTGGEWRIENGIFRNNGIGTNGRARVSGTQYLNNTVGHYTSGHHNSPANPNSFEGNRDFGVGYSDDARNNWWGSPSGPTTPQNRGGMGDRIQSELTQFKPFLTSRPNYNDAPPEVRLVKPSAQQDPGSKIALRWEASDDGSIVSQKILFSAVGNYVGSFQTIATLPGNQRSYEWTVPAIGFQVAGANAFIKVVAIDNTGKESFDEWEILVPTNNIPGQVTFALAAGQVFEPGQDVGNLETASGIDQYSRVESYIEVIGTPNRKMYTNGGDSMPFLSSDTVRFVVAYGDTTNRRKYWYSPIFSVRPKAILGDAAPAVALVSPGAGASFAPGAVVPISWSASDDEGLRGFDIVASFDDARTWQPVVANLPGDARSYDWQTPPGSGFANVRVMVIAKDFRFQTSSAGRERVFSTNSNNPNVTVANLAVNPATIATSQTTTGTVTLNRPAALGGTLVTLASDTANFLIMPANVNVPAGASSATFEIRASDSGVSHTFQVSATAGGVTKTAPLSVTLAVADLELPATVPSGSTVSGSVSLSGPAPEGGAVVNLTSTDPNIAGVPASVVVPQGEQTATFNAAAGAVSTQKSITISGEHSGSVKQTTITVAPGMQFTAVSRKTHSGAGAMDINLPVTGTAGIENRTGGASGDHQIIATFPRSVSLASASVTQGEGSVSGVTVNGSEVLVNLTGVTNGRTIGVTLSGVNNGQSSLDYYVPLSVLAGDTNGDGNVNAGDALQTRSRSGQTTNSTNFRFDVNLDGSINAGDATFVKNRSGSGLTN